MKILSASAECTFMWIKQLSGTAECTFICTKQLFGTTECTFMSIKQLSGTAKPYLVAQQPIPRVRTLFCTYKHCISPLLIGLLGALKVLLWNELDKNPYKNTNY